MYVQRLIFFIVVTAAMGFGVAQANSIGVAGSIPQQTAVQHELLVDITVVLDNDERGAASNIIQDFYVGSRASITSLKWDVKATSNNLVSEVVGSQQVSSVSRWSIFG